MRLFTTYRVAKYAKRNSATKRETNFKRRINLMELCNHCGYERAKHADNANEDCPV